MLMIGHLAEAGVVIHEEFRAGNAAPASRNLKFIKDCEARLPKGHSVANVRIDSAGYQQTPSTTVRETLSKGLSGRVAAIGGARALACLLGFEPVVALRAPRTSSYSPISLAFPLIIASPKSKSRNLGNGLVVQRQR